MLTKKQYETAKKTVKIGEPGDSQFTKNLADILWEREMLARRSVTGARPRKKGETDGENNEEARPACTPEKRNCIKRKLYISQRFSKHILRICTIIIHILNPYFVKIMFYCKYNFKLLTITFYCFQICFIWIFFVLIFI